MKTSVIIPTFNGAQKIVAALTSLEKQTFRDFEVVIVIDGSTDNTESVVQRFKASFSNFIIRVTRNGGRAAAKNEGAIISNGNLLIFVDDDLRLFENAIERHINHQLEHPDEIIFGHLEMDPEKVKQNDFWNYRRTVESSWRHDQNGIVTFNNYGITSANLSLSKQVFEQIGGFDSTLRDCEDFDFGIRAIQQHITIRYVPEIDGYHDDFSTLISYINRQNEYKKAKYILLEKHPEYKKMLPDHFELTGKRRGDVVKRLIFKNSRRWEFMFDSKLFSAVPQFLRYKLYSTYIYVHSLILP
ncbi:glycosyltransferase [soil metagenome]